MEETVDAVNKVAVAKSDAAGGALGARKGSMMSMGPSMGRGRKTSVGGSGITNTNFLKSVPLFQALSETQLNRLMNSLSMQVTKNSGFHSDFWIPERHLPTLTPRLPL